MFLNFIYLISNFPELTVHQRINSFFFFALLFGIFHFFIFCFSFFVSYIKFFFQLRKVIIMFVAEILIVQLINIFADDVHFAFIFLYFPVENKSIR